MRIEKHFIAGIARGLAYYACGFALVWLTYLVFGWEYMHAPGLHHLVGLLVLVIGAIILILNGAMKRDTGEPLASESQPIESNIKSNSTYAAQPR